MSNDLNQTLLIGRLTKDPEIKYTANGTPVTKFSIANNSIANKTEYVNYFDVNVWGTQAVNCEKYLKKGSQIAVNGSLRQNRWQDQSTGQVKSKVEINAFSVQFLGSKQNGQQQNAQQPGNYQQPQNSIPQQNANNINNAFCNQLDNNQQQNKNNETGDDFDSIPF